MGVVVDCRPAVGAEHVFRDRLAECRQVALKHILALEENDIFSRGIEQEESILGAKRAITTHDLLRVKRRQEGLVLDLAAMAVGMVPDLGGMIFG